MKIEWLGHACFLVTTAQGTRIVTDPFDEKVGYSLPQVNADIVTISHHHFDHDAVHVLPGQPQIIEGTGNQQAIDILFHGIASFHDQEQGAKRGPNTIFTFELEGIRLAHLGDLGHLLGEEQLKKLGRIDVLFIPVGGFYTIDANEARQVVEQIKPRLVLPMHYKYDDSIQLPIAPVQNFLEFYTGVRHENALEISTSSLPENMEVVVLNLKTLS